VKGDLIGAWVVHPKIANFHWSLPNPARTRLLNSWRPEVELTHSAIFVAQSPEGGEHQHTAQVSIRKSDEEETNSDGRCLAVPLLRNFPAGRLGASRSAVGKED
jgi:hypothetical protein